MTPIAPLIEAFLNETLTRQRGASRHTRDSYALSFQPSHTRGHAGRRSSAHAYSCSSCSLQRD